MSQRRAYIAAFPLAVASTVSLVRRRMRLSREVIDDVVRARGVIHVYYRDDGTLQQEMSYFDDEQYGVCRAWYRNGARQWEMPYIHDRWHGLVRGWQADGTVDYAVQHYDGYITHIMTPP